MNINSNIKLFFKIIKKNINNKNSGLFDIIKKRIIINILSFFIQNKK